jgi:hypothetical protein
MVTRAWHGVIAALTAFALVGQAVLTIDRDRSFVNFLSYFTIESNILVLVTCVLLVVRPDRGGTAFEVLRLGSLTAITVTGLVYATVLAGNGDFTGIEWWFDKIFHYIVPAMSVVGFLAFRPRTVLSTRATWSLAFPIVWLAYTLVRAEVAEPVYVLTPTQDAHVPYGFLDAAENGAVAVTIACLIITAVFVALELGYIRWSRRDTEPAVVESGDHDHLSS